MQMYEQRTKQNNESNRNVIDDVAQPAPIDWNEIDVIFEHRNSLETLRGAIAG